MILDISAGAIITALTPDRLRSRATGALASSTTACGPSARSWAARSVRPSACARPCGSRRPPVSLESCGSSRRRFRSSWNFRRRTRRERRALAGRARADRTRRRDRHLRRRAPRAPGGDRGDEGGRPPLDRRHLRPASEARARLRRPAPDDASPAHRADRGGRPGRHPRRRVHRSVEPARAGGIRGPDPRADRDESRRRGGDIPLRAREEGRRRAPPPSRARGHRRAARRRRVVEPDPRAPRRGGDARGRRAPRPGRTSSKARSSRATSAAARSGSRPRTSQSSRISSCPRTGSTRARLSAGRAAISIGVNPHYGGNERRIEAFLLDFEGDLYGKELGIELWERLRDERAFDERGGAGRQIALDVEATRASIRPSVSASFCRFSASL